MTTIDGKCDRCGATAVFEGEHEGDRCEHCDRWLCQNCIDYKFMRSYDLTDQFVCIDCAGQHATIKAIRDQKAIEG